MGVLPKANVCEENSVNKGVCVPDKDVCAWEGCVIMSGGPVGTERRPHQRVVAALKHCTACQGFCGYVALAVHEGARS